MDVGTLGQRGEDLAPRDLEAAFDGGGGGCHARGRTPAESLGERLRVDQMLLEDPAEQALATLVEQGQLVVRQLELVGDRPGQQAGRAVHVERQGRRSAVAPSSSATIAYVGRSAPSPPNLTGMHSPRKPASRRSAKFS